ncbi:GMC family oxidoreductase [Leptospira borgpetersenii serovar Ballum]|nr:FAD binding domain protein [Leptospira borgpetersenii str. 4E]EKQ98897.1 FAD binding domain protein [Leptospira borgpetersenii serovar Castellonis str. 200801910]EMO11566.1 FAD binding domain protein [Leptospira borgpetersenii str. Noumea 25]KGE22186.1 FAD-binding protein [Leptospira borgpetersenii serovar Ballum]MBF3374995.1 GMC family oxidoreductase [Leptospira borgpetersenii serovar Arborea]QHE25825.1 FAD-binding protein [Leptospira borgpetersenii]
MSRDNMYYDAVVIGSGFGGSISALRLSEKGQKVLVLERGKNTLRGIFRGMCAKLIISSGVILKKENPWDSMNLIFSAGLEP